MESPNLICTRSQVPDEFWAASTDGLHFFMSVSLPVQTSLSLQLARMIKVLGFRVYFETYLRLQDKE